jgi:hypothetical protein
MVEDEKTLHSRAFDEKMTLDPAACGGGSQLAMDAVPQIATRAPTLRRRITESLIGPAVLSK